MRVVIAGGHGQIALRLTALLAGRGDVVTGVVRNPGHRADILRPAFTDVGIGIARGAPEVPEDEQGDSATYTTDFGGVVDPSLPNG